MRHIWEGRELGLPSNRLFRQHESWDCQAPASKEKSLLDCTNQHLSGREQITETQLSALGRAQAATRAQSLGSHF